MVDVDWRVTFSVKTLRDVWAQVRTLCPAGYDDAVLLREPSPALDALPGWTLAEFCANRAYHVNTHGDAGVHTVTTRCVVALDELDDGCENGDAVALHRRHLRRAREGLTRSITVPDMTLAQVKTWLAHVKLELAEDATSKAELAAILAARSFQTADDTHCTLAMFCVRYVCREYLQRHERRRVRRDKAAAAVARE